MEGAGGVRYAVDGMRRIHFEITDSTNTQARALAAAHPGERLLVTAAEQSAGRGRRGRRWHSPRGGAWMTIVWPMNLPAAEYRAASLAVAVGVRRAVVELSQRGVPAEAAAFALTPQIKWPNDLLIDGAKAAGILCEQASGGAAGADFILIGIGVNVAFDLAHLDVPADGEPLRHRATTLEAALGRALDVDEVINAVSGQVAAALEQLESAGFAGAPRGLGSSLLQELRGCLAYVGTERRWSSPRGEVAGRVAGVDDFGRLMLETDSGPIACDAGELTGDQL